MNCTVRRRFTARAARVGNIRIAVEMAIFVVKSVMRRVMRRRGGEDGGARIERWMVQSKLTLLDPKDAIAGSNAIQTMRPCCKPPVCTRMRREGGAVFHDVCDAVAEVCGDGRYPEQVCRVVGKTRARTGARWRRLSRDLPLPSFFLTSNIGNVSTSHST